MTKVEIEYDDGMRVSVNNETDRIVLTQSDNVVFIEANRWADIVNFVRRVAGDIHMDLQEVAE